MHFINDWIRHVWELVQTVGWWFFVGLLLCIVMKCCLTNRAWTMRGSLPICLAVLGGAALPMCNFAVVPLVACMLLCGSACSTALAFLAAGVLVNPAALLLSYAYMGPVMTGLYALAALLTAFAAGLLGRKLPDLPLSSEVRGSTKESIRFCLLKLGRRLAAWMLLGIVLEGALLALFPAAEYQALLLAPAENSVLDTALLAVFRHICIPDDIALTASLVASGLTPGKALLFLLLGVGSNLPELTVLWGISGKKTALCFLITLSLGALVFWGLSELLITPHFVPKFSLTGVDAIVQLANRISVRTWMPMRLPCAVALLLMGLSGLRNINQKFFGVNAKA